MPTIVALVTARGGSKGIPGKNIALVAGKPLIAWSIEAAYNSRHVSRTIVSSDDDAILRASRVAGAETPFVRPAELAGDTSTHLSVVLHALDWLASDGCRPDWLVLLQPTSPLRSAADIDAAIELAIAKNADAVVSVTETHSHPWLTKQLADDGRLVDFAVGPKPAYLRRQDLPAAYALNGAVYVIRPDVLREAKTFLPANTYPYVMPTERSLDVDTPWDLQLVRLVMDDLSRRRAT
jgi:CMP-N-acetylneuraminic acid synthetase